MLGLLLIIILIGWAVLYKPSADSVSVLPVRITEKLDQLWQIAQQAMREKKYLRAEKALLTILRVDDKNATAYNRLGILYAKQQAFKDAIECFEIAQSLEPSASSLHNVGLIYYETENYEKAALAFEQALDMEDGIPARYIAYAKVQEKLGHKKSMLKSLEKAVAISKTPQTLTILAEAYDNNKQSDKASAARKEAAQLLASTQPQSAAQQRSHPTSHAHKTA